MPAPLYALVNLDILRNHPEPTWYDAPRQIHRTPRVTGDSIDPRSQIQ
jgi:hypothetical protein